MAVIILGAGATRGASFVSDAACKPPLDSDFFTQGRRTPTPFSAQRSDAVPFRPEQSSGSQPWLYPLRPEQNLPQNTASMSY
jgi:hypothetical protein